MQLTGDLPPRRIDLGIARACAVAVRARVSRCSSSACARRRKVPEWERIATGDADGRGARRAGTSTVDEAMVELDRKADEILEKRRWMLDRGQS